MLARDYCDAAGRKLKPVILSHHMLYGLKKGQAKMSKSDPDSAIFMEDAAEDVARKIQNAFCPSESEEIESSAEGMSLIEDELKNPCLDYIRYVLFSREGFSFKTSGKVFDTFEDLKQAFVSGELSEAELKESLTSEVNALLEPVRKHFEEDAVAKELLSKVTEWRRETLTPTSSLVHLRLDLEARPRFVVFAPLPSELVRLADVFEVLNQLRNAKEDQQIVLWLKDWSGRCLGCAGGSVDCVQSYYELLLNGLRTIDPDLMSRVEVCWQGKAILTGPSDYWTSVINAGRQCSLEAIRGSLAEGESLDGASQVIAAIMHLADALALVGGNESQTTFSSSSDAKNLQELAVQHLTRSGLQVPELRYSEMPSLRLKAANEGLEADNQILLTDKDMDVNRKVK
eukprot:CAMPEP_0197643108 /NCGR_PEP_ID=MMETSP1338-20131121/16555_1 /TAXON_ID=43686 ORGANISM="Pelagodinium beii, Strain RCC1491" /NCGR_SAMPLE_ID=MMETSP1338 /ASSEMBLY_ACC=CAM_ASM_000754 /LENGTH=399 /DNA_ID=CAMNT_0043216327 /DNA_START=24 /DNA_END=1220 /DNA_ORIENTATION=-